MSTTDEALALESRLREHRLPELLPDADAFVLPDYGGRSLVNVPATVARILGATTDGWAPPLQDSYWVAQASGVDRVVLILLDALGYLQLRQMLAREPDSAWARMAARGVLLPMTSVYPSTTDAALASLMTGVEPLSHGLLGYELWLREYGVLANMLRLAPVYGAGKEVLLEWGMVPETFLPVPGLGTTFAQMGIETCGYVPAQFTHTGLTRMLYRGFGRLIGYEDVVDLFAAARRTLEEETARPSFHWLYWSGIDAAIHAHGSSEDAPDSWQVQYRAAMQAFEGHFLNRLPQRSFENTLFLVCADHGFVDSPVEYAHDADADLVLSEYLAVPPSGEPRAAYLHCRAAAYAEALTRIQDALGDGFLVRPVEDVIKAGLFGSRQPAPESRARLGDLHAFCRSLHFVDRGERRRFLRGLHGGLTAEEMLVPWLAFRLDGS